MRARLIKPTYFRDVKLLAMPPLTRLLFAGLWTVADRLGRLEDDPGQIKLDVLPLDEGDVDTMLEALACAGLIRRYQVHGRGYIQVVNFLKHQTPHVREPASIIPAPGEHTSGPGPAPGANHAKPRRALVQPSVLDPVPVIDPVPVPDARSSPPSSLPPALMEHKEGRAQEPTPLRAVPKPHELERAAIESHPLFAPLVDLFHRPPTRDLPSWRDDITALEEMGATPEQVPIAAAGYAATFGHDNGRPIAMTRKALITHWYRSLHAPLTPSRTPVDGRMPVHGQLDPDKYLTGQYARFFNRPYEDEPFDDVDEASP